MKKKKIFSLIIAFIFAITLFPIVSMAATHDIGDGAVIDLNDATYTAGDTLNIAAHARVTISGTKAMNIVCGEGVALTLSGATIDVSATSDSCPLSFTGSGNMLNLTDGTTSMLKAGANAPAIRVEAGTELTIGGDGTLDATGGNNGAGIGGGENGNGGTVIITGGTVIADGWIDIGSGQNGANGGTLIVNGAAYLTLDNHGTNATVTIGDAFIRNDSTTSPIRDGYYISGSLFSGEVIDVSGTSSGTGYTYNRPVFTVGTNGDYLIVGSTTDNCITVASGVDADIVLFGTSITPGSGSAFDMSGATVDMVLCGSSTLSGTDDNAGLRCPAGALLTISGSGSLNANSTYRGAGIGGSNGESAGNITILEGTVNAHGNTGTHYDGGAGIGGGNNGSGGTILISGGTVTAASEGPHNDAGGSAAIGGGESGGAGSITITGGTVTATAGREYGCGIGCGYGGYGGSITISGGTVTATSGAAGEAAIGGRGDMNIAISGGMVHANGQCNAVGIGDRNTGAGTITISGGIVYAATCSMYAYDIGSGQNSTIGTLSISGTAAVFLSNDSCTVPTTTTHTHETFTENTTSVYGLDVPDAWTPTFGAYLQLYTLSYSTNGGSGTEPSFVTQHINTTTSVDNTGSYARTGYTQASGWNTAVNGSGTNYESSDTFTFTADTTLYAKWTPNTYTVVYDPNGGSGTTATSSHTYDASKALTANGFKKTGCTFAGWATSAAGDVAYTEGQSIKNLSSTDGATVTLYAKWTAHPELSSSDDDGKIYKGGRIVLTPNIDGGTWNWDKDYFSATFNSPATFTALKAGISTITYTVDGVSVNYVVTVEESVLPSTGQDYTWVWVLNSLAIIIFCGALWLRLHRSYTKKPRLE